MDENPDYHVHFEDILNADNYRETIWVHGENLTTWQDVQIFVYVIYFYVKSYVCVR